jgi:hypothetical protein
MNPAFPRAIGTSSQVWKIIQRDVELRMSRMAPGWNRRLQDEIRRVSHEASKSRNAGYYLPARVDLEINLTNERAEDLYAACCEVADVHAIKRDRRFYRAVFECSLGLLFGVRRGCLTEELTNRDRIMRTPGGCSAALGHFAREMDKLTADWNTRLEIETRDRETRERVCTRARGPPSSNSSTVRSRLHESGR